MSVLILPKRLCSGLLAGCLLCALQVTASAVTDTPTETPVVSATPTYTATPIYTITLTVTPTFTPTYTATPTRTVTLTRTVTRTVTVTLTATISPFIISRDDVIAYPSPAKGGEVWFYYYVSGPAKVDIQIHNVMGERMAVVDDVQSGAGFRQTRWDISSAAPGVYLYKLHLEDSSGARDFSWRKLVIVK